MYSTLHENNVMLKLINTKEFIEKNDQLAMRLIVFFNYISIACYEFLPSIIL